MSDAWLGFLGSVVIALLGAAGAWGAAIFTRKQAAEDRRLAAENLQVANRNQSYDQIQEDLAAARGEIQSLRAELHEEKTRNGRDKRYLNAVNRVFDDEVNDLRKALRAAGIEPPERRALPPFPGDWSVTESPS